MTRSPRYKQTEDGVIPEDWEMARIIDVASITTGSRNTQNRIEDGAFPFFVRSQTVERINSYSFDGEAVLTASDGVGTGKIFRYSATLMGNSIFISAYTKWRAHRSPCYICRQRLRSSQVHRLLSEEW